MKQFRHEFVEFPASAGLPALAAFLDASKNERGKDLVAMMTAAKAPRLALSGPQLPPEQVVLLTFRSEVEVQEEVRPDVPAEQLASVIH